MMERNNEIRNYSPILDSRAEFDGGKRQMDEMEERLRQDQIAQNEASNRYKEFLNELLENAPVISVVSDEAVKQMNEGNAQEFIESATNVARITEKQLLDTDNPTESDITNTFMATLSKLCEKSGENEEHNTWRAVKILKDAWVYGEVVRKWWNQKYLSGEAGEVFPGVYDPSRADRNLAYRIAARPEFPGKK